VTQKLPVAVPLEVHQEEPHEVPQGELQEVLRAVTDLHAAREETEETEAIGAKVEAQMEMIVDLVVVVEVVGAAEVAVVQEAPVLVTRRNGSR